MLAMSPRRALLLAVPLCIVLWFAFSRVSEQSRNAPSRPVANNGLQSGSALGISSENIESLPLALRDSPPSVQSLFEQTWALNEPPSEILTHLKSQCDRTVWRDDLYMHCGGLTAGLTSIMASLRVCFKMALDAGIGLAIPVMALRDSKDLKDFKTFDADSHLPYGDWFDEDHLIRELSNSCPQMKVARIGPDKQPLLPDSAWLYIDLNRADGFRLFDSWAWPGRTWNAFFWGDKGIKVEMEKLTAEHAAKGTVEPKGARLVSLWTPFCFFKITEDVTGHDLRVWHELDHLIRFRTGPRKIVHRLLEHQKDKPFVGVHYRGEKDNIWSSAAVQLARNLEMAEAAWALYLKGRSPDDKTTPEKLIYLACGDQDAIREFTEKAATQGWKVIDKWSIATVTDLSDKVFSNSGKEENDFDSLVSQIDALPFDHQGSIDLAMVTVSTFFIGFTGSAFSYTVANHRDPLGRYRGSTMQKLWDEGALDAKTHLFNDGESGQYPCCL